MTFWQKLDQKIACKVYKVSSIPNIVAQTDLIGIVPRKYAEHVAILHELQILTLPTSLSNQRFHMIWHERNDFDSANCWLRNKIRAIFSQIKQSDTNEAD